ncbi:MAG: DUF1592 domain-containing protein [Planctomycetia bacterium]
MMHTGSRRLFTAGAAALAAAWTAADCSLATAADAGGFLRQHCADCHSGDTPEGALRIDDVPLDLSAAGAADRWERIITRVEAGEMPPPEAARPPAADVAAMLDWAKAGLATVARARRAEGGRVAIRRHTRREYENTLHDLLGVPVPLADLLPEDGTSDGFDTASAALAISPVHVQRFMDAAKTALEAAAVRGPRPETKVRRFSYDPAKDGFLKHPNNEPMIRVREGEMFFFAEPHGEVPAVLAQFAAENEGIAGVPRRYTIRVKSRTHDAAGAFRSDERLNHPHAKGLEAMRHDWRPRTTRPEELTFSVVTTLSKQRLGFFQAPADAGGASVPEIAEIDCWLLPGETIQIAPYRLNEARGGRGLSVYPTKSTDPARKFDEPEAGLALVISWVEFEGPIVEQWPPVGHTRIFGDLPLVGVAELPAGTKLPPRIQTPVIAGGPPGYRTVKDPVTVGSSNPLVDARRLLAEFLPRAFRRPIAAEEIDPYVAIVEARLADKECFEVAMQEAVQAVLCSPDFLFLVEPTGPLSDHALAARLSYFLWRTAPDDELRAAAAAGRLREPGVLRGQTERLLASPRSRAFIDDFLDQWLELKNIDATTPDKQLFPEFFSNLFGTAGDVLLRQSMLDETRLFFADLVARDQPVSELVAARHSYLNNRLARWYDIDGVDGVAMQRVSLAPETHRGGLLTQASVLKVTAAGLVTSPVVRGAWVRRKILGREVPPPPADAGSVEPDTRGATTIREQLAAHRRSEACAGCHRQIDPAGFALEAFDPTGQFRGRYRSTQEGEPAKRYINGHDTVAYKYSQPVDATGELADGRAFAGPDELRTLLASDPVALARCLTGKLAAFGTGRSIEPGDRLAVDRIVAEAASHGFGIRSLIHALVRSDLFHDK